MPPTELESWRYNLKSGMVVIWDARRGEPRRVPVRLRESMDHHTVFTFSLLQPWTSSSGAQYSTGRLGEDMVSYFYPIEDDTEWRLSNAMGFNPRRRRKSLGDLLGESKTWHRRKKDKFGREWRLPANERCPSCGQPDSCGDCNHQPLTDKEVKGIRAWVTGFVGGNPRRFGPKALMDGIEILAPAGEDRLAEALGERVRRRRPPTLAEAKKLYKVLKDSIDIYKQLGPDLKPYDFDWWHSMGKERSAHEALKYADELMGGAGIEGIYTEGYGGMDYVNLGDTYSTTLIFDHQTGEFEVGSWGDWLEAHERPEEPEDDLGDDESDGDES